MKKYLIFLIVLTVFVSCNKSFEDTTLSESIIGNWSMMEVQDTILLLTKTNTLPDDEYGITFKEKGKLLEWKNIGWCATPPITFGEYEGEWSVTADSIMTLETEYWGGTSLISWKILELNNSKMKHYVLSIKNYPDEYEE